MVQCSLSFIPLILVTHIMKTQAPLLIVNFQALEVSSTDISKCWLWIQFDLSLASSCEQHVKHPGDTSSCLSGSLVCNTVMPQVSSHVPLLFHFSHTSHTKKAEKCETRLCPLWKENWLILKNSLFSYLQTLVSLCLLCPSAASLPIYVQPITKTNIWKQN